MKIKKLKWEAVDATVVKGTQTANFMTTNDLPQMLYRIRYSGLNTYSLYFYHGYVNKDKIIFDGTISECKVFAQQHFERYIVDGYFDP